MKNVVVIGAGPAGMTAAAAAARFGARVTLIEKNKTPGVKLLLTGDGRCNLTNMEQSALRYHRASSDRVPDGGGTDAAAASGTAVLPGCFGLEETLGFFASLGLALRQKDGCVYPLSNRSESVLGVLVLELGRLGVKTVYNTAVKNVYKEFLDDDSYRFYVKTGGWTYEADAVVISCGSMSAPRTGSTGDGYRFSESFGHDIIRPLPSLVPLYCSGDFWGRLSGVRMQAAISLFIDGSPAVKETGEVQFIKEGISGIPVFQISRLAVRALYEKHKTVVKLNLLPEAALLGGNAEDRGHFLDEMISSFGHKSVRAMLLGLFPGKMADCILSRCGIPKDTTVSVMDARMRRALKSMVYSFEADVCGYGGFERAQATSGGVDMSEVCFDTMESRLIDGLYFAGEVLDVDGDCGGYNLQWAWSSGYTAGKCAALGGAVSSGKAGVNK